ncbi:MAG: hypothetical protein LBT44_02120 [Clostridiales bacterium]|jgi:hypothetical protein|nr:hypothetical protein [Clostridiales bacterium]
MKIKEKNMKGEASPSLHTCGFTLPPLRGFRPRNAPAIIALVFALATISLSAQDDFAGQSFGFDDAGETAAAGRSSFAVNIGGEAGMTLLSYTDDLSKGLGNVKQPGEIDASLNFSAVGSFGEAVINLKLNTGNLPNIVSFDEVYARAWFGDFEIEAGMRKLTWGKADSLGPLDVINPLDYSELTSLDDIMNIKIANTMVHGSYRFGQFSKIEAVFVPVFEPWHFAKIGGRWTPSQFALIPAALIPNINIPNTESLGYAQAGLRFTTTAGPADIGFQYYYGYMGSPAMRFSLSGGYPSGLSLVYNPDHQIGVDWAQVLFGFNVRAELAANITSDLEGDDGAVYNPQLAWAFGFDRDLVWGINLNIQVTETVKLLYDKIADTPMMDTETGADATSTRFTGVLSKKFLRDELELRAAAMWGIEDGDFLIMPAVIWTKDAVALEVSAGIFGGDKAGQLGQYRDNTFIKVGMKYTF